MSSKRPPRGQQHDHDPRHDRIRDGWPDVLPNIQARASIDRQPRKRNRLRRLLRTAVSARLVDCAPALLLMALAGVMLTPLPWPTEMKVSITMGVLTTGITAVTGGGGGGAPDQAAQKIPAPIGPQMAAPAPVMIGGRVYK